MASITKKEQTQVETRMAQQVDLLRRVLNPDATNDELAYLLTVAKRTGLDPFRKQIQLIKVRRRRKDGTYEEVPEVYTRIDGYRAIAERTKEYEGQQGPFWCDKDGKWYEVWLFDEPPSAAKVLVFRRGFREPIVGIATWREYAQGSWRACAEHRDVQDNAVRQRCEHCQFILTEAWRTHGPTMLAKCAEALALRKAFPAQFSGLYVAEELHSVVDTDIEPARQPRPMLEKPSPVQQWARLRPLMTAKGLTEDDIRSFIMEKWGLTSSRDLTAEQWAEVFKFVEADTEVQDGSIDQG